ncbi:hypothetical protein DL98DRAFT_521285 [Cadophora sp. DSE1049]|nr:hypothetical protein DL98DRAFT_521285 [Cadophora sp. DSE1049]
MDEFAQSREDDDLFADEFEPLPTPTAVVEQPSPSPIHDQPRSAASKPSSTSTPTPSPATAGPSPTHQQQQQQQQRNGGRQDGGRERRGRGGGRGGSNGLSQSRYAPPAESSPSPSLSVSQAVPSPSAPTTTSTTAATSNTTSTSIPPTTTTQSDSVPPPTSSNPPLTTDNTNSTRTHAVRGDRSATGGPAHKKLTEEELTEKMAKMAILNAQKAEKHRLTEADQAAFQHREKELAKERREKALAEKKNERVMEMERAKNRERKMKAQGGREWDSEKVEGDIVDGRGKGRSSEFVRGGHGGVIRGGLAGSRYSVDDGEDIQDALSSRGRGGFEIRGRGRGGRGGRGGKAVNSNAVPSAEDFPSLPTPAKAPETSKADMTSNDKVKSPTIEKPAGDWAEEMATPIEEKKMEV